MLKFDETSDLRAGSNEKLTSPFQLSISHPAAQRRDRMTVLIAAGAHHRPLPAVVGPSVHPVTLDCEQVAAPIPPLPFTSPAPFCIVGVPAALFFVSYR